MEVLKEHLKALYYVLSKNLDQTPEALHFDNFDIRDEKLFYRDKGKSLTIRRGKLRSFGETEKILGKEGLCDLGCDIPIGGKLVAQWAIMVNRIEEELPSMSDVARADDIELDPRNHEKCSEKHGESHWATRRRIPREFTHV